MIRNFYNMFIVKPLKLLWGIISIGFVMFMIAAPFIGIMSLANVEHNIPMWFSYLCWAITVVDFIILANFIISDKKEPYDKRRIKSEVRKKKIDEIIYEQEEKK